MVTVNTEKNLMKPGLNMDKLIRGFILACTDKSESECLINLIFAADKAYGPVVNRIRTGDLIFLHNVDKDVLYGIFEAVSDGYFSINKEAFGGHYPYQIKVKPIESIMITKNAKKILTKLAIKRNKPLYRRELTSFISYFIPPLGQIKDKNDDKDNACVETLRKLIEAINTSKASVDIETEIPMIESTTFWDFPKQSYGLTPKGNNKYAGVTPALIIYNMVWRYTEPGDLVVDPMCGSGTTIDVCKAEKRDVIGYDIVSTRPDIIQNDARRIPLENDSVDMVFIDSPYGDNIKYNGHVDNIGNISAESEEFYNELEKVMEECHRIMKENKILGWLIGDQWVKKMFTPVGFTIYDRLCKYFEPVDIICVNRRGQSSNTDVWHQRARRFNFYLRGFKYLIIVRKNSKKDERKSRRKVEWTYYNRGLT